MCFKSLGFAPLTSAFRTAQRQHNPTASSAQDLFQAHKTCRHAGSLCRSHQTHSFSPISHAPCTQSASRGWRGLMANCVALACLRADSYSAAAEEACAAAGVQGDAEGREPGGGEGAAGPELHLARRVQPRGGAPQGAPQLQHRAVPGMRFSGLLLIRRRLQDMHVMAVKWVPSSGTCTCAYDRSA